jgi:hypothetical protein
VTTRKWTRLVPYLERGKWNTVHVLDAVMESSLSGSQKLVLLALVTHVSKREPQPSPGMRRLSAMCALHPETVGQNVDSLERIGLIRVVDRRHRRAHVYDLAGLMKALLSVPPKETASDRNGDTDANPKTDRNKDTGPPDRAGTDLTGSAGESDRIRGGNLTGSKTPKGSEKGPIEGTICASTSEARPFALTSPGSEKPIRKRRGNREPKAGQTRKPSKRTKPDQAPDPRVTDLRDHYVAEHLRLKGVDPTFAEKGSGSWGQAMAAFKSILGAVKELDPAKAVVTRALTDEWHGANASQPWEILKNLNKHRGSAPARVNGRKHDVQGGAADVARIAERSKALREAQGIQSLED